MGVGLTLEKAETKLKLAEWIGALADAKMQVADIHNALAEKDMGISEIKSARKNQRYTGLA